MKTRAVVIIAASLAILAAVVWMLWGLVRQGLPLQWVAIFVGGTLAVSSVLAFLIEPLMRKVFPDLEARHKAVIGYALPRPVLLGIRIAYMVLGSAAVVWGLMVPL